MAIYNIIFAYLLMMTLIQTFGLGKRKELRLFYVLISIVLVIVSGCRYGLESDYWWYYRIFNGQGKHVEFGFTLLINIVRIFTKNFNVFCIIIAILSLGTKLRIFSRYKYSFAAAFIFYLRFFVLLELNTVRQGLAAAFLIIALMYLLKDNNKMYTIMVLIATTFHVSSICFLVLLLLKKRQASFKNVIIFITVALLFRISLMPTVIKFGQRYLRVILSSTNLFVSSLGYVVNNQNISEVNVISIARIIIPVFLLYYLRGKKPDDNMNILFNTYLIGGLLNIAFWGFDTLGFRLASVFYIAEPIFIALALEKRKHMRFSVSKFPVKRVGSMLGVFFVDIWSFYALLTTSTTATPYKMFFLQ